MVARTVAAGPVLRVQQPPAMILTGELGLPEASKLLKMAIEIVENHRETMGKPEEMVV